MPSTAGEEVVTVIEVLSPANKTVGEGHRLYRRKQQEVLNSQAHLIEIDLLAEGLHGGDLGGGKVISRHTVIWSA